MPRCVPLARRTRRLLRTNAGRMGRNSIRLLGYSIAGNSCASFLRSFLGIKACVTVCISTGRSDLGVLLTDARRSIFCTVSCPKNFLGGDA